MKVKLKKNYTVCVDGIHPETYKAGDVVDLPERIGEVLVGDGRAAAVKAKGGSPENKMEPGADANKSGSDQHQE